METKLSSLSLVMLILLAFLALTHDEAAAQRYVDPRANMGGYESWCRSVGGMPYSDRRGVGCTPGSGSSPGGGYAGGSSPANPAMAMLGQELGRMLGEAIASLLFPQPGTQRAAIEARRQQLQAEQRRQQEELARQQRIWDEWRRQEEDKRRREFEEARDRMLGQMRGVETGSLTLRDPVGSTKLEPRMPTEIGGARFMTTFERAQCAAYLLWAADDAAGKGKFNEAAYLSGQAGELMGGGQIDVVCPVQSVSKPPSVASVPTKASAAAAREIEQRTRLVSALYSRANQQIADFAVVSDVLRGAETRVQETKKRNEDAQRKLDEVKAQRAQDPEKIPESVLEEALKAYQDSERLLAEAERDLQTKKESLSEIEAQMRHTKDLFAQARNPDQTGKILKKEFSQEKTEAKP